jgi:asparagine synthase (glutamine-hydrolysing)
MTGPAPLVGIVNVAPRTDDRNGISKGDWIRQWAGDGAAVYVDDLVAIAATFVFGHRGVVVAASPSCERDWRTLQEFSDTCGHGQKLILGIIEHRALTCSLAVYLSGSLILFRDRLGVDGLYYRSQDGQVAFSSALAPLIGEEPSGGLDIASAMTYLLHGRARLGRTFLNGLESLPSAHFVRCRGGPIRPERYWSPLGNPMPIDSRASRINRLGSHLEHACRDGFAPEGNALFLSGGMDSSYLARIASQTRPMSTVCYTVAYADGQHPDEYRYARIAADAFGLPLKRVELTVEDSVMHLRSILNEPRPVSAWATICNNALIDAAVADGNVHIVSGLGADEVLANYRKALDYYFRARESMIKQDLGHSDLLAHVKRTDDLLFPGVADFFSNTDLDAVLAADHDAWSAVDDLHEFYRECGPVDRRTHLFSYFVAHECQHRLPDALLRDFESHAHRSGAHIAFPFLDPRFVESACSLYPSERFQYNDNRWHSKVTMKAIVSSVLPDEIMRRERGIFDFPFRSYLHHDTFRAVVLEELTQSPIWDAGLFKSNVLAYYLDAIDRSRAGAAVDGRCWPELWVLLTLSAWYGRHLSC